MKQTIRGFTLLEMLLVTIVVGILGIYLASIWPSGSLSLDSQTEQLARDIRYTQALAMGRGASYRINLDAAADQYTIFDNNNNPVPHPARSNNTVTTLQGGVQLNTSGNIIFSNKGVPTSGAGNYTLTGSGGNNKQITVTPETGSVIVS